MVYVGMSDVIVITSLLAGKRIPFFGQGEAKIFGGLHTEEEIKGMKTFSVSASNHNCSYS